MPREIRLEIACDILLNLFVKKRHGSRPSVFFSLFLSSKIFKTIVSCVSIVAWQSWLRVGSCPRCVPRYRTIQFRRITCNLRVTQETPFYSGILLLKKNILMEKLFRVNFFFFFMNFVSNCQAEKMFRFILRNVSFASAFYCQQKGAW